MNELKPRTAQDWSLILLGCGVKPTTAEKWGPVFAAVLRPYVFSRGEADLVDFLPTILVESAKLERLVEDGRYSAPRIRQLAAASGLNTRWRSMGSIAESIANNEDAFFEACYGGRMGNNIPGDGSKYRGRGLIMLTGKSNYAWQGAYSGQDLVENPQLAEQPHFALQFAIDWWEGKIPDSILGDTVRLRKIVNGGVFGLAEVQAMKTKVQKVLT
jgi:putative chitinase